MGYINFKEERFKARNQLKNRRKNNKKLFDELIKTKELPKTYNPDKEYSYKEFKDKHFGGGKILGEEEFTEFNNIDIVCSIFSNCTFYKEESEKKPSLNRFDNFSCEFNKCNIYAKFDGCTLSYSIFDNCLMHNTFYLLSDMNSVIIVGSELKKVRIEDCDLSGAKIMETYIIDLDFTDKMKTKLDEKTFIDKIELREKNRNEYEGIYMTYETIADKFKENTLNNNFGEYYYLAKKTENNALDFIPRLGSYLYWATCGYGERPINPIVFSFIIIIIFGVLYCIFGIKIDDTIVTIFNSSVFQCLKQGIILSINLFSGVVANESIPVNISEILASFEILFGVIMMGIGTGVVVRKLVR